MLHGCTIGDGALIGIQAIVLNNARIGRESLVGAGAIVGEGKTFPDRSLLVGAPAKLLRTLTDDALAMMRAAPTPTCGAVTTTRRASSGSIELSHATARRLAA